MRKALILLLGVTIITLFLFIVPVLLIIVNVTYNFPIISNSFLKSLGFVFCIFGLSATFVTIHFHFLTGRVTPVAIETPKKLIKRGFYGFSRNPMYIAILLTFLGGFLVFGHLLLLIYFFFAAVSVHLFVVYKEEPELKKLFGKEYEEYIGKVPRWLPKFF